MKRRFALCIAIILSVIIAATFSSCNLTEKDPIDLSGSDISIQFTNKKPFEYDGFAKTPNFNVLDGYKIIEEYYAGTPNDNIVVEYSDNVEVGTATVTITAGASGKFSGATTAHFEITSSSNQKTATDFDSLKEMLNGGRYSDIILGGNIIVPEGESLTVASGVVLDASGYAFVNNGTVTVDGELLFNESGEGSGLSNSGTFKNNGKVFVCVCAGNTQTFVNDGTFENAGEMYVNGTTSHRIDAVNKGEFKNAGRLNLNASADFYNHGSFENNGDVKISTGGKFYTDSEVSGKSVAGASRRYPIEEFNVSLGYASVGYDGKEKTPSVMFKKDGVKVDYDDYTVTYTDNVETGTAKAIICATKDSDALTGEITLTFSIVKGIITVDDAEEFYAAVVNTNYAEINVVCPESAASFFQKEFTVPEGMTINVSAHKRESFNGNVINNGKIVFKSTYGFTVYGTLVNNGEIIADNLNNIGTVQNDGSMALGADTSYCGRFINNGIFTLAENAILYAGYLSKDGGEFVNNGSVTSDGKIYLTQSLTNNGTFENAGDIFVFSTAGVYVDRTISNSGNVYLNAESNAFSGGYIKVKEAIENSDIVLTGTESLYYDGKVKEPEITVAGGNADKFSITYIKGVTPVANPVNAGEYTLRVTFDELSTTYHGSAEIKFTVKRGKYTATGISGLTAALDDYNYDTVELTGQVVVSDDFTLPSDYTLIVAGGGRMHISGVKLNVEGSLIVEGELVCNTTTSDVVIAAGGTIVNNGECYFNAVAADGVQNGDGAQVYVRENIADATVLTLLKTQVEYSMQNGYNKTEKPGFEFTTVDGAEVSEQDYTYIYSGYDGISTEESKARLVVRANSMSKIYFGSKTANYDVLPGETVVSTLEELITALEDVKSGTELCNFGTITLDADIIAGEIKSDMTIRIAPNCVVEVGDYTLDLYPENWSRYSIDIINKGVISVKTGAFSYIGNGYDDSEGGKIVGYAADAVNLARLARLCDEVYLTADIDEEVNLYTNTAYDGACVIDTCGFDIKRIVVKMQGRRSFTLKSSVSGTEIGSSLYGESAIYCDEINSKATLTLVNITVYGIEYNYLASEEDVVIDQSCNVIG